jgi:hypothetical protein
VLVDLLALDLVMSHALVLGEIACGTPPNRVQTLADLDRLQSLCSSSPSPMSSPDAAAGASEGVREQL